MYDCSECETRRTKLGAIAGGRLLSAPEQKEWSTAIRGDVVQPTKLYAKKLHALPVPSPQCVQHAKVQNMDGHEDSTAQTRYYTTSCRIAT